MRKFLYVAAVLLSSQVWADQTNTDITNDPDTSGIMGQHGHGIRHDANMPGQDGHGIYQKANNPE